MHACKRGVPSKILDQDHDGEFPLIAWKNEQYGGEIPVFDHTYPVLLEIEECAGLARRAKLKFASP